MRFNLENYNRKPDRPMDKPSEDWDFDKHGLEATKWGGDAAYPNSYYYPSATTERSATEPATSPETAASRRRISSRFSTEAIEKRSTADDVNAKRGEALLEMLKKAMEEADQQDTNKSA